MNLIKIQGDRNLFEQLKDIEGVLTKSGVEVNEAGTQYTTGVYATDAGIAQIQALGGIVEIIKNNEQLDSDLTDFYNYSDDIS